VGMTAAEKAFRIKTASATGARDWPTVEKVFTQYGTYLELVGGEGPADTKAVVVWPRPTEDDRIADAERDVHRHND
jgi:hypothetical protein